MVSYTRKGSGENVLVPQGIDPGFDHNPATSRLRGVVPQLSDKQRDASALAAIVRAHDMPPPTRISMADARTPTDVAALPQKEDLINWVLGQFGASIGHPQVYDSPSGLQQVISEELFIDRSGPTDEWKILKFGRGDWLPLIIQTLRNPDQVRTVFPRDEGLLPRVRMIRQFVVGDGNNDVSVIVVWEYDKKDLQVDLLVGRSAYVTKIGDAKAAAKERVSFLEGKNLLYDRRYGPLDGDLPK